MKRVFICGEGSNELGSWGGHPSYQADSQPGVIETLCRSIRADGWTIIGGMNWKDPRKIVAGAARGDEHVLKAAALRASEAKCDVLLFVRDQDSDLTRPRAIAAGVEQAKDVAPEIRIGGGLAVQRIEAWLLSIAGQHRAETHKHPQKLSVELGIADKDTAAMVAHVEQHGTSKTPPDAASLHAWIESVRNALFGLNGRSHAKSLSGSLGG